MVYVIQGIILAATSILLCISYNALKRAKQHLINCQELENETQKAYEDYMAHLSIKKLQLDTMIKSYDEDQ